MFILDTANLVTYSELFQLLAIFSGVWLALLSLVGSVAVTWYIRDGNRRDHDSDRRFREAENNTDRRFGEVDRRFTQLGETTDSRFREIDRRFTLLEEAIAHRFRQVDHRFGEVERRFVEMDRRFTEMEANIDRRLLQMEDANDRRHYELLQTIGLLYHHVHADGSPATIPLPDADPAVPAPADN